MPDARYCLVVCFTLLKRLLQAFVILPSIMAGIVVFVLAFLGAEPVKSFVEGMYQYADTRVRVAKPGHVQVMDCSAPHATADKPFPAGCAHGRITEVPVAAAVEGHVQVLRQLYLLSVMLSVAVLLMCYSWRDLIGAPALAAFRQQQP